MNNSDNDAVEQDKSALHDAWDDLIQHLQNARDVIDNPEHLPPPATSRVLAEGYRYLAGFIHHGLERSFYEDPNFPVFRNALSMYNRSTIDNPDAIYFYAPIDGSQRYLIRGNVADSRHWRGEERLQGCAVAPQYVIFETANGPIAGDTGELTELMPGFRTGFGTLGCEAMQVDENGQFELLLGPKKPEGYSGNFICTHKPPSKKDPESGDRYATYISGRQLFYDWENEEAINLTIVPLDNIGGHPPAYTPALAAENMRRMGSIIDGQMRFWMKFYDQVLNCNGRHENVNNSPYFMPVNAYNEVNSASSATGGGMSTNIYAGGIYDLADDEALYIEAKYDEQPMYTSIHLGNLWGESPDYHNHQSSLNEFQMHMGPDNVQRWVVAHRDPGVQNWLDTTGLPRGYLSNRWAYATRPAQEDWPTIFAKKIRFNEIGDYMPDNTPVLSAEERKQEIGIRQLHVQKRYRMF